MFAYTRSRVQDLGKLLLFASFSRKKKSTTPLFGRVWYGKLAADVGLGSALPGLARIN
jgi:hypothetical protein